MISETMIEDISYEMDKAKHNDKIKAFEASKRTGGTMIGANAVQYGGDHYKKYGNLQPWDVIVAWKLDYLTGTALKYIARWEDKGGIEDLKKAIHFLEKKIEVEKRK